MLIATSSSCRFANDVNHVPRGLWHVAGAPFPRSPLMSVSQCVGRSSHGSPRRAESWSSQVPPRPIAGPARSQVPVLRSSMCRLLVQPITGFTALRPPTRGDSRLLRTLTRHPVPRLTRRGPSGRHAPKSQARFRRWLCTTRVLRHRTSRYAVATHACSEVPALQAIVDFSAHTLPIRLVAC